MSLSERQLSLVIESAELLIKELKLTKEEAIQVVSNSLKKELTKRNITMEALELGTKPDRTSFIRGVVQHVKETVKENPYWRSKNIDQIIENFYKIIHDSWQKDR